MLLRREKIEDDKQFKLGGLAEQFEKDCTLAFKFNYPSDLEIIYQSGIKNYQTVLKFSTI